MFSSSELHCSSDTIRFLTQVLSGGVRREGNRGAGGVTSRAGKEELQRSLSDVTRGEGGSAARAMDEGVRAGRGDPRRERWTRGSARGRGIRGVTDG